MAVRVEFFGFLRMRAGVEVVEVEANDFGTLLQRLEERFPALAGVLITHAGPSRTVRAFLNGLRFISHLDETLSAGDEITFLSADAGG